MPNTYRNLLFLSKNVIINKKITEGNIMFGKIDNVGGTMKVLAKVLCWIGIIGSFVWAIILLSDAEKVSSAVEKTYRGFGFAVLILGPLFSWVSSFFLYGFGELIETNCEIARNTRKDLLLFIESEYKTGTITVEEYNKNRNEILNKL